MKKKIIIFGATGNVGSYLLKYALEYFDPEKYEVIASGRRQTDFFEKRGIPYVSVDITKEEDFAKLPTENGVMTYVLHSNKSGIFKSVVISDELRPYLYRSNVYKKPGDSIEKFDGAGKAVGLLFFRFPTPELMNAYEKRLESLITIELEK